jgi:hypothetical protein
VDGERSAAAVDFAADFRLGDRPIHRHVQPDAPVAGGCIEIGPTSSPRRSAPRWLTSPVVTTFREMLEMRYVWRGPVRMDNTRLIAELGREPHTPLHEAVEATLRGLGCVSP